MINSNSKRAALYHGIFSQSEPMPDENGIYIGKTLLYKLPFFLDLDSLVNPHISIIGTTGSGKTFLAKSIIARAHFSLSEGILILDWNAEYTDVVNFVGGQVIRPNNDGPLPGVVQLIGGVKSIDLSALADPATRLSVAEQLLARVHEHMISMPISTKIKQMIVIDEAWKLLGNGRSIARLFREGRKFGFGMLVVTQLVADVNNEVLANAAASFIFRLQGSDNLSSLISAGIIGAEELCDIPLLSRGGCIASINRKGSNAPRRFRIGRVSGLSFKSYTIKGESLIVQIPEYRLRKIIEVSRFGNEVKANLFRFFEDNWKGVDITNLVGFLMREGLERAEIIMLLREMGISDASAALAIESQKVVMLEE